MAAFTTIAAGIALGTQAALMVHQGEQQKQMAKKSLRAQNEAQQQAQSEAIRQKRENEMAINKANRKQPDLLGLLDAEQQAAKAGSASTMLTGRRRSGLGAAPDLLG